MNTFIFCVVAILYIFVGVVVAFAFDESPGVLVILFWPSVLIIMFIFGVFVVGAKIGSWIHERINK